MNQHKRKVRIGVLGAGGVAKDLHLPALINMPAVSISWLCDKEDQRARQLAKLFAIPAVFMDIEQCSDVDIVLVAIPVGYRSTVMQSIFRRGWHAFCEKPFALTLEEHDQYLAEARANNVQVGVGLVRRYCPATFLATKLVRNQYFGDIVEVWANEGMRTKRTGRDAAWYIVDPKAVGGGVLMEFGSHLVDQLFTILNVSRIRLDRCIQQKFNGLDFETRFIGRVSTEHQHDIRCAFGISRLNDLCNGVFIQFSSFILKCGLGFDSPLELYTLDGMPFARLDTDVVSESAAFSLEWQDFMEQCRSGNPSAVSADTARHSTAIIEQCYRNAEVIDVSDNKVEGLRNG